MNALSILARVSRTSTIGVLKQARPGEHRAALSPDIARKFVESGARVLLEMGAGTRAGFLDEDFSAAGAELSPREAVLGSDIILTVRPPSLADVQRQKPGACLVGLLEPARNAELLAAIAAAGGGAYALELLPRTTRAQAMDVLSSQANLAGYRAAIEAAYVYSKVMPMMTTAAGAIPPARVFVMGAGVAGLQAIATARRLGAVVTATDVRPAVKEQVQSLGAKFIAVEDDEFQAAEAAGGYARAMSPAYMARQAELISEHIRKQDIVITTALIPGRPAPRLVTAAQAASMRRGSVLIDLAVEQGGNIEGSDADRVTFTPNGATIVGLANPTGQVATDASTLYARNIHSFVQHLIQQSEAGQADGDDILEASVVVRGGGVLYPTHAS